MFRVVIKEIREDSKSYKVPIKWDTLYGRNRKEEEEENKLHSILPLEIVDELGLN